MLDGRESESGCSPSCRQCRPYLWCPGTSTLHARCVCRPERVIRGTYLLRAHETVPHDLELTQRGICGARLTGLGGGRLSVYRSKERQGRGCGTNIHSMCAIHSIDVKQSALPQMKWGGGWGGRKSAQERGGPKLARRRQEMRDRETRQPGGARDIGRAGGEGRN